MKKSKTRRSRRRRPLFFVANPNQQELKWLDDVPAREKPVNLHGKAALAEPPAAAPPPAGSANENDGAEEWTVVVSEGQDAAENGEVEASASDEAAARIQAGNRAEIRDEPEENGQSVRQNPPPTREEKEAGLAERKMPGRPRPLIYTDDLADESVTEEKLAPRSIGPSRLAPAAVGSEAIEDYAVTSIKLADGSVTETKLAPESVTGSHLVRHSISGEHIRDRSIGGEKLRDGSITPEKLADRAIGADKIAEGSIESRHLKQLIVTEELLADHAVTSVKIRSGAVLTEHLANESVDTAKLGSGAVTASKLRDGAVTSEKIAPGAVESRHLMPGLILAEHVAPGELLGKHLAPGSVRGEQLAEGAPADVFAAADDKAMAKAVQAGVIDGEPQRFARNRMTIAVAPGNPKKIDGLTGLRGDVVLVTCAPEVPCGRAAQALAANANVRLQPASEEPDVKSVLGKVAAGEADAGLVYVTDVRAAAGKVDAVPITGADAVANAYPIATTREAAEPDLARQFVEFVLSDEGQRVLRDAGFDAP